MLPVPPFDLGIGDFDELMSDSTVVETKDGRADVVSTPFGQELDPQEVIHAARANSTSLSAWP